MSRERKGVLMMGQGKWKALLVIAMSLGGLGVVIGQSRNPQRHWGPGRFPPDENPQFFPSEVFGTYDVMMDMAYSWYLRSMEEQPLAESVTVEHSEVYRVVVLPPYSSPVVVRFSISTAGIGEVVAKVGQSDRRPEILAVHRNTDVSHGGVDKFLKLLDDAGFWSMPTHKRFDVKQPVLMGDASWMFEGIKDGRYHLVDRGASELGPLKDSLLFLVAGLAKVDLRSLPTQPTGR
jgi:hypothetical protein